MVTRNVQTPVVEVVDYVCPWPSTSQGSAPAPPPAPEIWAPQDCVPGEETAGSTMETDSLVRDPQTLPQHRLGRGETGPGATSQVVITPELSSLLLRELHAQHITNSELVIFTPIL